MALRSRCQLLLGVLIISKDNLQSPPLWSSLSVFKTLCELNRVWLWAVGAEESRKPCLPGTPVLGVGETEAASAGGWRKGGLGGLHNALPPGMNERILTAATSPARVQGQPLPGPVPKQVLGHGGVTTTLPSTLTSFSAPSCRWGMAHLLPRRRGDNTNLNSICRLARGGAQQTP